MNRVNRMMRSWRMVMPGTNRMDRGTDLDRGKAVVVGQNDVEDLHVSLHLKELRLLQSHFVVEGGKVAAVNGNHESHGSSINGHAEVLTGMEGHSTHPLLRAPDGVHLVVTDDTLFRYPDTYVERSQASTEGLLDVQVEAMGDQGMRSLLPNWELSLIHTWAFPGTCNRQFEATRRC